MGIVQVLVILATIAIVFTVPFIAILISERAAGWWKGFKNCVSGACGCSRLGRGFSAEDQRSSDSSVTTVEDSERGITVQDTNINKERKA